MALTDKLTAIANAIRAKTGGTATMTLAEMPTEIASIQTGITPSGSIAITENGTYDVTEYASADVNVSGGTEITDGIVVTEMNAAGYPTKVEIFAADGIVHTGRIGTVRNSTDVGGIGQYINNIEFKSTITGIDAYAFSNLRALTELELPQTCVGISGSYHFAGMVSMTRLVAYLHDTSQAVWSCQNCSILNLASLPYCTKFNSNNSYGFFRDCTMLRNVQLGSVGHGITQIGRPFRGCTSADLLITAYCTGSYANQCLSGIRSDATNATIIIKASEATTYGGVSYSAGDTMITSTP